MTKHKSAEVYNRTWKNFFFYYVNPQLTLRGNPIVKNMTPVNILLGWVNSHMCYERLCIERLWDFLKNSSRILQKCLSFYDHWLMSSLQAITEDTRSILYLVRDTSELQGKLVSIFLWIYRDKELGKICSEKILHRALCLCIKMVLDQVELQELLMQKSLLLKQQRS